VDHRGTLYEVWGAWRQLKVHTFRRYLDQVTSIRPAQQVLRVAADPQLAPDDLHEVTDDLNSLAEEGVREGSVVYINEEGDSDLASGGSSCSGSDTDDDDDTGAGTAAPPQTAQTQPRVETGVVLPTTASAAHGSATGTATSNAALAAGGSGVRSHNHRHARAHPSGPVVEAPAPIAHGRIPIDWL
jgi:hypothetical protein